MRSTIFFTALVMTLFTGCEEEKAEAPPSMLGFSANTFVFSEADPSFFIPLTLEQEQFGYVSTELLLEYRTPNTQSDELWVDPRPVYIYGGATQEDISVVPYNDVNNDGNDTIDVILTNLHGNAFYDQDPEKRKATIILKDDDNVPSNEMNIHINWNIRKEVSRNVLNDFDVDLYLLTDVVKTENGIEEATFFNSSENTNAYEDVTMLSTNPDKEYYIIAQYIGNAFNDASIEITGSIKLSGFGYHDDMQNRWTFTLPEPGYYAYLGPFKKTGKTFILK
jgi:hypothetical protein